MGGARRLLLFWFIEKVNITMLHERIRTMTTHTNTRGDGRSGGALLVGRALGLLLASVLAWGCGVSLALPGAAYAAERSGASSIPAQQSPTNGDALGGLGTKIEDLAKKVARIATPVAILCIVLVLVLYLFAPMLPEIAQQNKGYIMRALVIVAVIGFVPEIVKFASGLAG